MVISKSPRTSAEDVETFFHHTTATVIAAIESRWLERLRSATIYRYTLPADGFVPRDATAGYWAAKHEARPIEVEPIPDLMAALIESGVELRIMPSLVLLRDAVIASTLEFDIIRWRNAFLGLDIPKGEAYVHNHRIVREIAGGIEGILSLHEVSAYV